MYTSLLLVAMAAPQAPADATAPDWKQDYATASRDGKTERKPLAVFVGRGADGWAQVSETDRLGPAVRDMLKDNYICLYIDRETPDGQKLATTFGLPAEGPGLVISDRAGELQAFRRGGKLAPDQLTRYLRTFADPNHVVRTTETGDREDVRFYPADGSAPAAGGGNYRSSGSYCPSCGR
jgi:hypothetical protein